MLRAEVGVEERRLEPHQRRHLVEEPFRLCAPVSVEQREHAPLELRALLAVGVDPFDTGQRQGGGIESVQRLEECPGAVGILADERVAPDEPVADEERVAGDILERRDVDRQRGSECRQYCDLELQRFLDPGAPREAKHPLVVDDRHLEVVAVVDLDDRPRVAPERVGDQPLAVGRHAQSIYASDSGVGGCANSRATIASGQWRRRSSSSRTTRTSAAC